MTKTTLKYEHGVTLVGAAPSSAQRLDQCLRIAPTLVAADGGADRATNLGHVPDAIIGDLDSLASEKTWQKSGIQIVEIKEQQTTDFEKCLYSIDAPFLLCCGFLAGRVDHALAAMSALLGYRNRRVFLVGDDDVCFWCPPALQIELPAGTRVSYFPFGPVQGLSSEGLAWPLAGVSLRPGGLVGTSNRAMGGAVAARFDAPEVVTILPVATLSAILDAFSIPGR